MNKNSFLATAVMLGVVLGCTDSEEEKAKKLRRQEDKEVALTLRAAASDLAKLPDKIQLANEPYIKGKMAIVRKDDGGSFFMYDPDVAAYADAYARSPEEVQTVVLRECQRTQKGVYRTKENPPRELAAYGTDCDVTLIDRSIPAVVYQKRFEAKLRDEAVTTDKTQQVEAHAGYEVDEFLKALPRK